MYGPPLAPAAVNLCGICHALGPHECGGVTVTQPWQAAVQRTRSFTRGFRQPSPDLFRTPKRPDRDAIRGAVEVHLSAKRITLWSDWDLTRPDSFDKAVEWLTDQVVAVHKLLDGAGP